jgi:hypothetical protein
VLRLILCAALGLAGPGCATRHSASEEVSAVVQDETARQAATVAARQGESSKAALEAGAAAADRSKDAARPPT